MNVWVYVLVVAVVVAYITKAYLWAALGFCAVWGIVYAYARLSKDPDAIAERLRLAQIEREMRKEGKWGDYDALRRKEEKYPKGAWLPDEVFLKAITEYEPATTPRECRRKKTEFEMAVKELDRRGYTRVLRGPYADGSYGYDIVKGNPPGAESLLAPAKPLTEAESRRQREAENLLKKK